MFHGAATLLSLTEAAALGCHVSVRGPRLTLRCLYSSPFSYFIKVVTQCCLLQLVPLRYDIDWLLHPTHGCSLQEKGADLETVRATILYRLQRDVLALDATLSCALSWYSWSELSSCTAVKWQHGRSHMSPFLPSDQAAAEGSGLVWTVPRGLSPLVHGQFKDRGVRFGINSQALNESESKEQGYKVDLRDGRVEVRILPGALGRHTKVHNKGSVY